MRTNGAFCEADYFDQTQATVNCPGEVTLITPPYAHIHTSPWWSTGIISDVILGFVEIHGDDSTGRQGIGVSAPRAAAVAVATAGFVIVVHIPKGLMFNKGTKSLIVATGKSETNTEFLGKTHSTDGAIPNEHFKQAPQTTTAILYISLSIHAYIMSFCDNAHNILGS